MSKNHAPGRSLEEWLSLVTQCRQSGLSDAAWYEQNWISASYFYNAVSRIRKKACQIPDPIGKAKTLDFTSSLQDMVRITVEPETSPTESVPEKGHTPPHLNHSHTIEIEANGIHIRMSNSVHPFLMEARLKILKEPIC